VANSKAWLHAHQVLCGGENALQRAMGTGDLFSFYTDHPELLADFQAAMTALTQQTDAPATIELFKDEWGKYQVICDVGGGHGLMLAEAVKAAGGNARGILFDRPEVIAQAPKLLASLGIESRIQCREGDFTQAVPKGVDLYILKAIMLTNDDEQCLKVLKNCASGLNANGRVLIVEGECALGEPSCDKYFDVELFMATKGRIRDERELTQLCDAAGLTVKRALHGAVCVLEAAVCDAAAIRTG
jgi:hypothetical protein